MSYGVQFHRYWDSLPFLPPWWILPPCCGTSVQNQLIPLHCKHIPDSESSIPSSRQVHLLLGVTFPGLKVWPKEQDPAQLRAPAATVYFVMELIDIVLSRQYVKITCKFLTTSCNYFNDTSSIEVHNEFGGCCREISHTLLMGTCSLCSI